MRIAVIGAGALGSIYGGMLTQAGWDVWMVDGWMEHIALIKRRGLNIIGEDENLLLMKGTEKIEDLPAIDLALIFVKSHQTEEVASELKKVLTKRSWAITLQRGIGNEKVLARELGSDRVLQGITSFGGKLTQAGEVSITAYGQTLLASVSGERPVAADNLLEIFQMAGLKGIYLDPLKFEGLQWEKMIVDAAIEPITAILRVPNGCLLKSQYAMAMMTEIVAEALAVAEKKGICIERRDFTNHIKRIIRLTTGQQSAMLQDILNKRMTEIDGLNGVIVREGEHIGIPTPINAMLTALIHSLEDCHIT